jgi:hypothetical protein
LEYANIPDFRAELFFAAWDAAYGIVKRVQLPAGLLQGFDLNLTAYVTGTGANTTWHFAEPPKWDHSIPGYGTLQVVFESRFPMLTGAVGGNIPFMPPPAIAESSSNFGSCDVVTTSYAESVFYVGSYNENDCVYTPFGWPGNIDPSVKFRYARIRDWDLSLFGGGIVGENPAYPGSLVDGSMVMRAISNSQYLVIQTSGSFNGSLGAIGNMSSITGTYAFVMTQTTRSAYGNYTEFPMDYSNTLLVI